MAGVFFISIFQVIFAFSDHFNDTPEVSAIFWGAYTIYSFFVFLLGVRISDLLINERIIDITKIYDEKNRNKNFINKGIAFFWGFVLSIVALMFGINLLLQRYHNFQLDDPPISNVGMRPVNLSIEEGIIGGGIITAISGLTTIIFGTLLVLRSDVTYKNFKYITIYFLLSSVPKLVHDVLFVNENILTPWPQIAFLITQIVIYIISYCLAVLWWKKQDSNYIKTDKISNPKHRKVVNLYFIWLFIYDLVAALLAMFVFWSDEDNMRNAEFVFYIHVVYTFIFWIVFESINFFGNNDRFFTPVSNKNNNNNNNKQGMKEYMNLKKEKQGN